MNKKVVAILIGFVVLVIFGVLVINQKPNGQVVNQQLSEGKIISGSFDTSRFKIDAEWKKILTPTQYNILRQAGTEVPFTGKLM